MFASGFMFPPVHFILMKTMLKMYTAIILEGTWDKSIRQMPHVRRRDIAMRGDEEEMEEALG